MNYQRLCAGIATVVAFHVADPLRAQTYSLTDLGPGVANDVNGSGKVVGNTATAGWYYDGASRTALTLQLLEPGVPPGPPPYTLSAVTAAAINDNGRIVGLVPSPGPFPTGLLQGYVWDGAGVGLLLGTSQSPATVNAAGLVGGSGFILNGTTFATPAGDVPEVTAINDAGLAVGTVGQPSGTPDAVIFEDHGYSVIDLSSLEALLPAPDAGGKPYAHVPRAVNHAGAIVGNVLWRTGGPAINRYSRGFLYANEVARDLGTLGGASNIARDINHAGLIVGSSTPSAATVLDEVPHAYVFRNNGLVDLNQVTIHGAAGWVLNSANAINDAGVIVGSGTFNGEERAFLLTPSANSVPPTINIQPVGTNVYAGAAFRLSVAAAASGVLSYQWTHAGTNVPGATAAIYEVAHATGDQAGEYQVVVSADGLSQLSDKVNVGVAVLPDASIATYAGLTINGPVGSRVDIQAVTTLGGTDWQTIDTVTLTAPPVRWIDPETLHNQRRYYRVVPSAR